MRTRISRVLYVATLLLSLSSLASAQSMKLLAPGVGWIFRVRDEVLWTSDGGKNWKNITPPVPTDSVISSIFFLDTEHGWVLVMRGEPGIPHGLEFDLCSTDNAGATWLVEPLRIPERLLGSPFGGGASLAFADRRHGWLTLFGGTTPISQGYGSVLATSDGGRTWSYTPGTPDSVAGATMMVTPQFGWLVGGPMRDELYVTRDGARSWQRVVLESPLKTPLIEKYDRNQARFQESFMRNLSPAEAAYAMKNQQPQDHTYAAYDLPTFKDSKHGYICVTYPDLAVLFRTEDSGVTWKSDRVIRGLAEHQGGAMVVSAVADSTWITGKAPTTGLPQLKLLGPGDHCE